MQGIRYDWPDESYSTIEAFVCPASTPAESPVTAAFESCTPPPNTMFPDVAGIVMAADFAFLTVP